ncbi:MAG TPA: valine--tRNA ligase [Beijerinckiaceae bacterium]|nr:valine--tRNA ligase [Beijerinckiaceae bacterium]
MMDKTYDPATIEARVARAWDEARAFAAGAGARGDKTPFCIVIPPPNVTGSLHMGHALNNTLQDILVRFERMRGKDVLWQPGTDHAGIATQMVVERKLAAEKKDDRRTMGRERFLEEVWAWKAESGGTIVNQLKRLGASCDWSRERFTMDPGLSEAVIEFFVGLHEAGLIYKDKRLVNWDPKLLTAISDLEVEQREVKGSFKWSRGETDKEGNPVSLNHAALGKLLDREPGGHLYYFDYPVVDDTGKETGAVVTVATTRPETMLGDTAVAVHPTDERYTHLVGKRVRLPLVGRLIPIVADEYSDPEKGTGAVKITPAHDFNDFEVGKRQGVPAINVMTPDGKMTFIRSNTFWRNTDFEAKLGVEDLVSELGRYDEDGEYIEFEIDDTQVDWLRSNLEGVERFTARKAVIKEMDEAGRLQKIEPTVQQVPHGDRSGVPIEPFLTDQWYVNVKPLADASMEAVKSGRTRMMPANREADFFRWMENIEPWCVSRQLWWGHQIPAWYGPDFPADPDDYYVARNEEEAQKKAQSRRASPSPRGRGEGKGEGRNGHVPLTRDPDVLDTWFSSALWPFSTLGWPEETPDLAKYYPNAVLITGFDILFFWVARMMMAGLFTQGEVPFRDVYLHGLVRDEKGQKMSKSKGNVLDPLVVIDALGADALRFTLAALAAQGRDPKLGVKTAEGYRNFCTKLWNASRFAEMNGCARIAGFDPGAVRITLNRWIVGETRKAAEAITLGITGYRFNDAAAAAYRFVWNTFCDWYLELAKPVLQGPDGAEKDEARATTAWALDQIVKLLHPFMPFITEELWAAYSERAGEAPGLLCLQHWPELKGLEAPEAEAEIGWLVDLVTEIRSARAEMNVPAASQIPLVLVAADDSVRARLARHDEVLKRLARLSDIGFTDAAPAESMQVLVRDTNAALPLAGIIDLNAERARLNRDIERIDQDVARIDAKLGNADFLARAPEEVVEEQRERRDEALARKQKLAEALARLG